LRRFLNNILNTRFEDMVRANVENAKNHIKDVFGDILGGTGAPGNATLVNLVNNWGGKREATILGYGLKGPATHVAWVNSTLCNSFDYAPLVVIIDKKRYPSHISGTTVPTAITMGESK
jgi:2-methylcitrate dehydratase PrpD